MAKNISASANLRRRCRLLLSVTTALGSVMVVFATRLSKRLSQTQSPPDTTALTLMNSVLSSTGFYERCTMVHDQIFESVRGLIRGSPEGSVVAYATTERLTTQST